MIESRIQIRRFLFQNIFSNLNPRLAQQSICVSGMIRIRIRGGNHNALQPGLNNRVRARGRAPGGAAWLQCHIECGVLNVVIIPLRII